MGNLVSRKRVSWIALLCILVSMMVVAVMLEGAPLTASAQGTVHPETITPQPSPTNNGGSAQWKVNTMTFKSNYPKGFEFALDANSSGGKIVEATIAWTHAPGTIRHAAGKIDDSGTISASWAPTGANGIPQWVGVTYWWILKDAAGNVYQTDQKYDEYADNTRSWRRMESEDIIVFWESSLPQRIGSDVIAAMAHQRPFYFQNWGKLLNYRPRAIIYASYKPFEEWAPGIGTKSPNGTVIQGTTQQEWGGTAQVYFSGMGIRQISWGTVLHEVGHLYQYANGGIVGPVWFFEGDASYFELSPDYDYLERTRELAAQGNLPTLQGEGPSGRSDDARLAYDIGYSFWVWLHDTYGSNAHFKVWDAIAHGKSVNDALQLVTGKNFVDMETAFRTWLDAPNPEPPTLEPTESFDFPPTPTYEPTATPKS